MGFGEANELPDFNRAGALGLARFMEVFGLRQKCSKSNWLSVLMPTV